MANIKRSILGNVAEMVIDIDAYPKGFEVFGHDKLGRKVVFARRSTLEPIILDGARVAQSLADFAKKPVTLRVQSEKREEFFPTTA
ncbi:hypothetical protein KP004_14370 [Geomonas oryzisoli]|uniref:Uncharacterized protein n=1 Tax=Geomonas oryzisoli TaxID=2847992 RepID=A0ABX8JA16_9BACT|nr:hypothetical protein [Geomonas oryzisoli]QWV92385.1 hypothetical protein KP004_14370 [Geomonas oryzisoli]